MPHSRCVFHARTPANAEAHELLPLSALASSDPEAFERAMAKYDVSDERRRLRDTWIPVIEARWTEVVFLTPIHPHAIWRAWRDSAGVELPAQDYWAISADQIGDAVLFDRHLTRSGDPLDPAEVTAFDSSAHRAATETTPKNEEWITRLAQQRKQGAWFNGTPQILAIGPVPLAGAELIDWSEPPRR